MAKSQLRLCHAGAEKGNIHFADSLLTLSLQQPADRALEAAAYFWKGDIAYDAGRFAPALSYLKQYAAIAPGNEHRLAYISPEANMSNAYLNMGYAAMEIQDFKAAQTYFARSRQGAPATQALALTATLREADAAFMQRNFKEALPLYENVMASGAPEADYAAIQKSIIAGLQGKPAEKLSLLQQVINKSPASRYNTEARYELAVSFIEDAKYQQAINLLQPITTDAAAGSFGSKALAKIGFSYQQLDNDEKAIEAYRKIVRDYPASEERAVALDALRSLYIERNQPQAYAAMLSEFNLPAVGSETLDSTYYAAAEAQIAAGKWAAAKTALNQYLERFPNGGFTTRAHYYKAESLYQLKENDAALDAYDVVLALPWNEFSEVSARRAAEIAYKAGSFARAAKYYQQLRGVALNQEQLQLAYAGLMRTAYSQNDFTLASSYADTLLAMQDVAPEIMNEVQFLKAKTLQQEGKNTEALTIYESLKNISNEAVASEARYRMAALYFAQGELTRAETEAANAVKFSSGNNYWVERSWLLIVDILVKQKDYFNAKATLQSIIKNAKDSDFRKEASQKLDEVKRLEKKQSKLKDE